MLDYADTLESGGAVNKVNEGYDDYFTIDDGFDSDSFTVRPIKKTTFDYTKATGYDPNKTYAENFVIFREA